jgi:hypothetical protein
VSEHFQPRDPVLLDLRKRLFIEGDHSARAAWGRELMEITALGNGAEADRQLEGSWACRHTGITKLRRRGAHSRRLTGCLRRWEGGRIFIRRNRPGSSSWPRSRGR